MEKKFSMKQLLVLLTASALVVSPTTMLIQPISNSKASKEIKKEAIVPYEIKDETMSEKRYVFKKERFR